MTGRGGAGELPDRTHWAGEPLAVWEALWGIPALEAWSTLPSTNDRARHLARSGGAPWSVVVADHQTAGRGRAGTRWVSEPAVGLWVSVVIVPRSPAHAGLLPLLAGTALVRGVEAVGPHPGVRLGLKWPNDVWLDGRKVAGILCEAVGDRVVVGMGLNLRDPAGGFPPDLTARAGSLEGLTERPWSPAAVLGRWLKEFRELSDPGPMRFEGRVADFWSERDILHGRRVRVGALEGVAVGVRADGALTLARDDGSVAEVRAGHVEWLDES
ncbi:MAG: biotin--[acetyl-CoA-carboxylase] ligase [Gemmatimonadetes bacterium]|nr:biotin--[acetyl-CoA-carboxylase] ligase [Gemmatimonadota bacterium]